MRAGTPASVISSSIKKSPALPETFLSCYELLDPDALRWDVRLYKVRRINGDVQKHEGRGDIRQAIWNLRRKNPGLCKGYGFVVDVDAETVAVPSAWKLTSGSMIDEYIVTYDRSVQTDPNRREHRKVIAGVLKDAAKKAFKEHHSRVLGPLWQDFDRFCQVPEDSGTEEFLFCRKIGFTPKVLRGNRWVIQVVITTATVDGRTFRDYYAAGEADRLADMIEIKQANRLDHQNRPVAVRVLREQSTPSGTDVVALELESPEQIVGHGRLSRREQAALAGKSFQCRVFAKDPVRVRKLHLCRKSLCVNGDRCPEAVPARTSVGSPFHGTETISLQSLKAYMQFPRVPLDELRLIVDAQLTGADHSETIIEPNERQELLGQVRDILHAMEAHGRQIPLSDTPVDAAAFPTQIIPLPATRVRGPYGREKTLPHCERVNEGALRDRVKDRIDHVRRYGFLYHRPIHHLLACPTGFGADRAIRMKNDLNSILKSEGVEYAFEEFIYRDVEDLRQHITGNGFDALLAILPESRNSSYGDDDTHERIKRRIDVPSQCIHHDNTLPNALIGKTHQELRVSDPKISGRVRQKYENSIWNLLVKHHWVPFAPNDPFHYNVQVGLDVGGRHNDAAMACLGYGFRDPRNGLLFRPEEIPIDTKKKEPIPTDCLYEGLLQMFEATHRELAACGESPDFERVLFFRDGGLRGDGAAWNEIDAIERLHKELIRLEWVSDRSVWTAVEVMKQAEDWRIMRFDNGPQNPLVGYCLMPFDDDATALVCTTGAPYLTQGTAGPLKVSMIDVYGNASMGEVLRDVIWSADLAFTKIDMGLRLPWTLHVADAGALQSARSYKITGVTA
jgi:hypothetical protein